MHKVGDVMVDEDESLLAEQVRDIVDRPSEEVVDGDNLVTAAQQSFAEMRTEEPRSPSDDDARHASAPPDGVVGEATAADGCRVEEVAGVDQPPLGHQAPDLLEVEPAKLVPL